MLLVKCLIAEDLWQDDDVMSAIGLLFVRACLGRERMPGFEISLLKGTLLVEAKEVSSWPLFLVPIIHH